MMWQTGQNPDGCLRMWNNRKIEKKEILSVATVHISFIPASNEPSNCLQAFGDCREGQIPPPLWGELVKKKLSHAPLLAAGYLTFMRGVLFCLSYVVLKYGVPVILLQVQDFRSCGFPFLCIV